MQCELSPPPNPYQPGTSVVLKADPEGAIMTVTDIRTDGTTLYYTVAWLDENNTRRSAEYLGSDLKRVEV
ncbi:MAG TPA: hypothetical protein VD994_14125 [Prosthecobacter sp.]|nr:hypothetical protein [Prosthecobacter sp.]